MTRKYIRLRRTKNYHPIIDQSAKEILLNIFVSERYKISAVILICFTLFSLWYYQDMKALLQHRVQRPRVDVFANSKEDILSSHFDIRPLCNENDIKTQNNLVLSYCLFGNNSFTTRWREAIGTVAEEARISTLYRDWSIRIYHDEFLTLDMRSYFKSVHKNLVFCHIKKLPRLGDKSSFNGMTWRFMPLADWSVDVMCSRDLDSPLLSREEDAVRDWLSSNKVMHLMRDRVVHTSRVMGGLWCYRNVKNRALGRKILNTILSKTDKRAIGREAGKGNDQDILSRYVYPMVEDDTLQHDAYSCKMYAGSLPFPTKRDEYHRFVGCVRPCMRKGKQICPKSCRPKNHPDWIWC